AQSIERFGYDSSFAISGLVALVAALLALALRPPADAAHAPPDAQPDVSPAAASSTASASPAAAPRGLRALMTLPAGVWLAALLVFWINFLSDSVSTFFPIYAVEIGIPLETVGLFKSAQSLAATGIRFAAAGLLRLVDVALVNHVSIVAMGLGTVALSLL